MIVTFIIIGVALFVTFMTIVSVVYYMLAQNDTISASGEDTDQDDLFDFS